MLPDRVSNPGPLTYESGALPTALRGSARYLNVVCLWIRFLFFCRFDFFVIGAAVIASAIESIRQEGE